MRPRLVTTAARMVGVPARPRPMAMPVALVPLPSTGQRDGWQRQDQRDREQQELHCSPSRLTSRFQGLTRERAGSRTLSAGGPG
jgi:hypothetical protein